jgi:hypothetical protein
MFEGGRIEVDLPETISTKETSKFDNHNNRGESEGL